LSRNETLPSYAGAEVGEGVAGTAVRASVGTTATVDVGCAGSGEAAGSGVSADGAGGSVAGIVGTAVASGMDVLVGWTVAVGINSVVVVGCASAPLQANKRLNVAKRVIQKRIFFLLTSTITIIRIFYHQTIE
jgi:hypothetical protein